MLEDVINRDQVKKKIEVYLVAMQHLTSYLTPETCEEQFTEAAIYQLINWFLLSVFFYLDPWAEGKAWTRAVVCREMHFK